jgi:DedD protein
MDQGLKERLVGAAVLVAIGVWLIPWVLDGPEAPLDTNVSSLQLPAAEEPMPMRTQTLRLGEPANDATNPPAAAPPDTTPTTAATEPRAEPRGTEPPAEPVAVARAEPPAATKAEAEEPQRAAAEPAPAAESARTPPPRAATPAPANARAPATPAPKPAAAAAGDWIVQLGSFGEEANARRLAQRASTLGYQAEVSSYRGDNRTLYRVRVGPATTRARADATASALKAHGLESRVVAARYE